MAKAPSIPVPMPSVSELLAGAVCPSFIWALQRMLQGCPGPDERQDPFPTPLVGQGRSKLLFFLLFLEISSVCPVRVAPQACGGGSATAPHLPWPPVQEEPNTPFPLPL